MDREEIEEIIYDKRVLDFAATAVAFCSYLEENEPLTREEWLDSMLTMLPLLYAKGFQLPETCEIDEGPPDIFVGEEAYLRMSNNISRIMKEEDVYLDVFTEDMKYSETPVSAYVSEDISDIYQDVRDFIHVFRAGLPEVMNDALYRCNENFRLFWGQKLVNVLRPLHALKCRYNENGYGILDIVEGGELWD